MGFETPNSEDPNRRLYELENKPNKTLEELEAMHHETRMAEARENAQFSYLALTKKREKLKEVMQRASKERHVAIPKPGVYQINKQVWNKETRKDEWESSISFGGGSISIPKGIFTPKEWIDTASELLGYSQSALEKDPKNWLAYTETEGLQEGIKSFGQAAAAEGDLEISKSAEEIMEKYRETR